MIKIVGNIVVLSALSVSYFLYTQHLVLEVTDMRDAPISSVEIGVPFKIKVLVHGFSVRSKDLVIQGLEKIRVDAHQEQISIINGVRSSVHTYGARIDTIGTYLIGPAVSYYQGKQIVSDQITITAIKSKSSNQTNAQKEESFARLVCEKDTIFLGEKVHCHIYFYTKNPDVQFTNLLAPSSQAKIDNTLYQGPFDSFETIQGTSYICKHIQWVCCPKSIGELIIPAYTVIYTVPSDERSDFGGFSAFFGMRPQQRSLYTNAVSLQVLPLPPYKGVGTVQAIGSYESFELIVKESSVRVGQAFIATIQLKGSGDIDTVSVPPLESLPSTCNYYDSQVTTTPGNANTIVKTFEYIMQATQPGILKIPEQKFIFFDTKKAHYVTLTTKPAEITVVEAPETTTTHAQPSATPSSQNSYLSDTQSCVDDSCPIIQSLVSSQYNWSVPWKGFLLLLLFPLLGALIYFFYHRFIVPSKHKNKNKRAFTYAKICLHKAEEKHAYTELYPIFVRLFSDCLTIDQQISIEDTVTMLLIKSGFSEQQSNEWQQFFSDCAAFVFLNNRTPEDPLLFKQAHYWLSILEQTV